MIESADEFVRLRRANDPRATHDDAPEAVWDEVIAVHPDMKAWVIHNKTVPLSILRKLAIDDDPGVRCDVATKRKCDDPLFEELAGDPDENVRHQVALNRKVPPPLLHRLASDPSEFVAEAARSRLREASSLTA